MRPRFRGGHCDNFCPRNRGRGDARIGGSPSHPLSQNLDGRSAERLLRGHLKIFVLIMNGLDEQAGVRMPRNDDRPTLPARLPARLRIEPQAGLLLFFPMTLVAVISEQRTNLVLEKDQIVGRMIQRWRTYWRRQFSRVSAAHEHHKNNCDERKITQRRLDSSAECGSFLKNQPSPEPSGDRAYPAKTAPFAVTIG